MADSRALGAGATDPAPTLAAALNAAYAARHGYPFSYFRISPTRETSGSASSDAQFGGRKADYCTHNAALNVARRTPWGKLLALWSVVQEELTLATCPVDVVLFIDSDAFVTHAGAGVRLEEWLNKSARLVPAQLVYEAPRPYGAWVDPAGWRPPAAEFLFASDAPWWPQGPTTGTFFIRGLSTALGRATAASVLAAWWDAPQPPLPSTFATIRSVPPDYTWNEMHPYEQTPVMVAVDAAGEAGLFDAVRKRAVARNETLLAIARHVRIIDVETFREQPGQFVRHASSFHPEQRLAILRGALLEAGLRDDDGAVRELEALNVTAVYFDAWAADARLRANFRNMSAAFDVPELLANGVVVDSLDSSSNSTIL